MYETDTITTLADIPPLVQAFATTVGFTVGGTSSLPTVQRPDDGTAISFQLSVQSQSDGGGGLEILQWQGVTPNDDKIAEMRSPRHYIDGAFTILQPAKLFMFGKLTPQPFLAIVIGYPGGYYRHLYLGHMEIVGAYTGGETIAGSAIQDYVFPTNSFNWRSTRSCWPFGSWQAVLGAAAGGVHIVHADNPTYPWRTFSRPSNFDQHNVNLPDGSALGGFQDNINDGYVARAKSRFNSANILVPVNLYVTRPSNLISPVGRVPGVRLVRLDDFDPEAEVTVGSVQWKLMPIFKKSLSTTIPVFDGRWITDETSYLVGQAYQMN